MKKTLKGFFIVSVLAACFYLSSHLWLDYRIKSELQDVSKYQIEFVFEDGASHIFKNIVQKKLIIESKIGLSITEKADFLRSLNYDKLKLVDKIKSRREN